MELTLPSWLKFTITNKNGLSLSALLCSPGRSEKLKNDKNREGSIIVVCHGFTGSKEGGGGATAMAEELSTRGFSTILFDFAGCGESEGRWENITLTGQIGDLGSVVDWCRQKEFKKIILTGRSFGGSTVLCYAARDHTIVAACTWAAVARPYELFSKRMAPLAAPGSPDDLIAIKGEEGTAYLKRSFLEDLRGNDPLHGASELAPRSLLIIHGSADQSVPVEEAELLYNRAREPKKLAVIEGADHRFTDHRNRVWKVFFDWLADL